MEKVVLISCVSKKKDVACLARELYVSDLFKKALYFAENKVKADKIFILSAKYGLVQLNDIIEPYDKTLNSMKKAEIIKWSDGVQSELVKHINIENDLVIFLAGEKYRKYLEPDIKHVEVPMRGMKIGEQLQYLKEKNDE